MNTFYKNILSIYGEKGKAWLENLQTFTNSLCKHFKITHIKPFDNLSFNYVVKGLIDGNWVVLKIGLDTKALKSEAESLKAMQSYGGIKLIDYGDGYLLEEFATPGITLKKDATLTSLEKLKIACKVSKGLQEIPYPSHFSFPHIKEWLETLDHDWSIKAPYINAARLLKHKLLKNTNKDILLHGDLHFDNIIKHHDKWLVIDPKGVMGPSIFETLCFIENLNTDIPFVANFFGFDRKELIEWYFVHAVLLVCWNLEDNIDPSFFMNLVEKSYSLLYI